MRLNPKDDEGNERLNQFVYCNLGQHWVIKGTPGALVQLGKAKAWACQQHIQRAKLASRLIQEGPPEGLSM